MKKTVQTTAWQFSKQLLAIACFLVIGMVQVAAQTTTNYVVSISVRNMSWSYPNSDAGVSNGDFGFVVGGNFYSLPEDGMPDAGNYVTNYNTGTPLNEIVWAGVVPIGTNLAGVPDAQVIFQAYENDCGDLMQFDTGFLDCGVNPDDSNVDVILGIDWLSVVPTDANGQPVPGTYNIGFGGAAGGPFNGGDGSSYDVAFTVTVLAVDPPLNACDLDVFPTGNGVSYACLSDAAANTSVFISGGTAPYKILGSGIYNAVTGDPFDFGVDPFGLTVGAGTFEFQVREGQPWTVIVQDAVGCIVAQEGVFDLPNPLFNTPATICTSDPILTIYENSVFDPAGDILNGQFFFSVAGGVDNDNGFSATFDPFIAGPGQHFIAYCVQAQGGGGPGFGPGNYEDGCQICYEQTIYVYPSFDGYDGAGNLVTEIGLNTGGSPEADAALQTNVCVGHANMSLGLTNFDDFDALFASLELAFDPNGQIDETDFFITWAGNGVTDNADGTATFSPAALGPVPPGGIATSIQVTVGYPSCPTVYVVVMNVMPNFNATVNDVATCATAGDSYDLTGAFGANTTAGGYFYTVGAGGALTAVTSGTLSEAANAGTSVTILYSNTAGLTNQSQCNADDCINCDTAVITFSGLTVDCSFALEDGPEVCRGTTPLVDTVVDPIITNSPVTGIQATAVGNNVIPKDLTTTASLGTIDPYGFINSIEVEINYTGLNGNTQGDHNGYSVTMPGGVTFVAADVPVGQTSNYTVTYTNGTAAWNTDIPTPNNDTFNDHTITWEQIQAAYANANLNINDVFTGTNAPGLVGTCQENEFTFDLETNANNAAISITVTPSYVEPAGFVTAFIWSTGTQLPAEAITFDNVTGEYYLNTLFTDANGSAWDLSTYLDIELVHTTYSCSAQLPDGTLCTQSCTEVIKVLPALITDIANLTACINDGAIDLEQMFIQGTATGTDGINITGGTTQGGVFTATNGTVNGTYFTPNAGATSSTITYTIGAGTGADGCDPLPSTATLTLETAADPEFNYPTTVCVGSIPALPAPADGTTSGLQVFDPQGNNISHAAFQAATVGGLYTIIQTTGPAGCHEEYTHDVLVVESPTAVSDDAYTVCRSQAVVDLTQFVAGSTMGGNFTGTGVAGNVLILGTLPSSTITYTVGSNGCTATTTFTVTIVEQPDAAFDVIDQICEGTIVNLYDYTLQDNGTFTDNGVAVSNPAAWTATGSGLHNLVYTITIGTSCTDTDQENVYVIGEQTVTAEYGFLCQSTTDFTVDLTNQLPDGSGTQNGGDFGLERVPPFISEIEYNNVTGNNGSGPWGNGTDFVEITGLSGVDLEHYALYFYKRMDYTNDQTYNDPTNSGAVYGVIDFADLQPGQTAGYGATPTTIDVEATSQDGIQYGSVAVRYRDCISATDLTSNDVSPIGGTITGIAEGPASIALVYKGSTAKIKDLPYRLGSDNVIQLIGYGTSGPNFDAESGLATSLGTGQGGCQEYNDCNSNTNAGIFTSCDGPAATLVSVDINVVDKVGSSVQFTNICWVNPNVQDPEVDYVLPTANNVTTTGNGIPVLTRGDYTSPGSMNVGLRGDTPVEGYLPGRGNGDELYYDYIAPNGDVMHLDRLCHTLFVGKQTINTAGNYDYDPDAPNEDLDDYYSWNGGQYGDPSNGDVNNDGVVDHNDGDVVEFTCSTMTYTIPFSYQILPGGPGTTQCGSNTAVFFLTVLMDGEENWNNYPITGTPNPDGGPLPGGPDDTDPEGILKSAVCDYTEHNLNTYIDDTVHWIAPIRAEGSYEQTANCTFAENIEDPIISEIEYQHYDYQGAAADDHCVVYNYADDHNTPFNVEDDTYEALQFCEGIEISAGEGTELSCYSLVFYSDQDVDLQSPSNALAYDVWYIGADGMPHKTDVANGVYMQLYGLVDNDAQTWPYPHGTVMTVPAFGLDPWGNNPVYAGANPYSATNQYGQVIAPDQANEGLFIDNNGNDFYNTSDIPVIGVPGAEGWDGTSFPWERGTECTGAYAKQNVGSRWFPVLNIPGHTEYNDLNGDGNYFGPNGVPDAGEIVTTEIGGVGILNHCTGKLVNFISWGANEQDITGCGAEATLCVEANEDFSMAGPFEQLQSYAINTTQNNNLGDLRTLQLVSASIVDGLMGGTCASEHADCNGNVWAIVYNGGKVMIPCCGPDDIAVLEEYFQYSNSIGYYNCLLDDELFNPDPYTCELDLTDAPFSDNYIITSHDIEVTIESVDENYYQLYTYTIESGTCANMLNISPSCANPAFPPVTLDEHVNTNLTTIVPGSLCNAIGPDGNNTPGSNDLTNYYEVDGEPTDALLDGLEEPWDVNPNTHVPGSSYAHWDTSANASNPGINLSWDFPTPQYGNNPWSNGIAPSPVYQGSTVDNYGYPIYNGWGDPSAMCSSCYADPNGCIGDGEYAPVMNGVAGSAPGSHAFGQTYTNSGDPTGSSQMSFAFNDGQGPLHTTGNCFQGYCTKMAKTKYTVKDLTAYLYNGNHIPGYQDGVNDTCRQLECKRDSFRVTIKVKINYEQCLPVGQFWGTDVAMTNAPEDLYNDYPYFQFAPQGLAETSPVSITYDVTNAHEIETDDATDDLACLDDDNDMMRTQDFEILPAGDASLNTATVSTCTNSPALNLSSYVSGTTGGTWTANGGNLNGNSFSSSTAGTFTLTYTVGGGDCQDAASLTVTVGQSGSINTAGLPTSVCAGTAVLLPAGTWSGDGVTGDTFSSNTAGTYTLTGTAGSGACATTATVSITVVPELSVAVTQVPGDGNASVTITVSGGVGPYTVNGAPISGTSVTFTVPCESFFQYNVDDASACAGVPVNGLAAPCPDPCTADAGALALLSGNVGGKICGNSVAQVQATGFADCATQTYALTDAAGNIVAVSASGQFNLATLQGADYTAWGVNFTDGTTVPTTVAEISAALGDDLDVTNPITITVVPEIEITLAAICDPNSGGYFLQATVSGGDPSINAFGSYTCNLSSGLVSGSFTTSGGDPINVVLGNGNATTSFAAGASVAVSFGDGSLCEASASFEFPDVACGIGAAPDNGFTFADQPIVIDVTNNDTGNLTPIAVTNPANGTATINPDGTITYTPDAGFTGTDVFVYQAITPNGSTVTSTVTVVVQGSSVAALSADWTRDCSDVATTSQYGVSVFIQGGVAPYTVAGTYNETNINDGNAFFSVPDGSGFQVVVTDANGNQFTIDESDIIPCSKVDAELVFSGEVKADGNLLKWTTFSEVNNDYFTLEFSRDGISYETIAIVDGAGNSTTNKNYNFTHKNVPNGVGYYRISTTDFDGTSVIKEVITLTRGEVKFGIVSLYPVPATTNLTVSFETAAAATVKASIFNVAGQLAIAKDVTAIAGTNTPTFNVTALPAGTYYISLNDGTNIATTKFVKQ